MDADPPTWLYTHACREGPPSNAHPLLCNPCAQELLQHTRWREGWEYVVEGSATNPKPGLLAQSAGSKLELCWMPHPGFVKGGKPVSFKLGYLKTLVCL
jgi:hypothetical protein